MTTRRRLKQERAKQEEFKKSNDLVILEPLTRNQAIFMDAIDNNDVVICDSISGTGKTAVSAGMAAQYLEDGRVKKIIIMRPAVQCGPELGHIPGTARQKIEPFMCPILGELDKFLTPQKRKLYEAEKKIEVSIIGYLRGTNLHDSFIIVDEMQNATANQLKMIGTRIGKNSKAVFIGDMKQTDIGYKNSVEIYEKIFKPLYNQVGFEFVKLTEIDIVRSKAAKAFATKCK